MERKLAISIDKSRLVIKTGIAKFTLGNSAGFTGKTGI